MEAAMAGDMRAYDRLLRAALPLLRGIAHRRIADPAGAEDAVQDALLAIHQLRHTHDPHRPLRPWLAAIGEARCTAWLQQRQRQLDRYAALAAVAAARQSMSRLARALVVDDRLASSE